ncbi:IS110 family transposase [Herbidospora galbida]|uniref:IS110 family transposase n=1 Tax=Herbidospora galbida TaxID=2575442 RepID=A0A4U3MQJ7_9ACTN|nr:transposase [Herbidospora galbida]TKK91410.1 IS110 family transposase [Herbidospora galbida]
MLSIPRDSDFIQDHDAETVVLGVDTHKDTHVAAVVSTTGRSRGSRSFPATATGYRDLLDWAADFGTLRRAGVEGTSSYGTALTRHLHAAGLQVLEANQPDKAERRRRGKTDAIDAEPQHVRCCRDEPVPPPRPATVPWK